VSALLIHQKPTTTDELKAVGIDEESARLLQAIDLYQPLQEVRLPAPARYYGIGKVLLGATRGREPPSCGHPD
jgi:hypothetical protein